MTRGESKEKKRNQPQVEFWPPQTPHRSTISFKSAGHTPLIPVQFSATSQVPFLGLHTTDGPSGWQSNPQHCSPTEHLQPAIYQFYPITRHGGWIPCGGGVGVEVGSGVGEEVGSRVGASVGASVGAGVSGKNLVQVARIYILLVLRGHGSPYVLRDAPTTHDV